MINIPTSGAVTVDVGELRNRTGGDLIQGSQSPVTVSGFRIAEVDGELSGCAAIAASPQAADSEVRISWSYAGRAA